MEKSVTLTVESRIYIKDNDELSLLQNYCSYYNFMYRKLFNIIRNDEDFDNNQLQMNFSLEHKIPVRLYKSLIINAKSKLSSLKELNKFNIRVIKNKIKIITEKLEKAKKPEKIYRLKCKLNKLEQNQHNLENKKIFNTVFGSKLFQLESYNTEDKLKWKEEWNRKRNYNIFLVGSKDETNGNNLCQLLNLQHIQLRLPNKFDQKHLNLEVNFNQSGQNYQYLKQAIENKQALTYRILQKENKKWYIQCSFSLIKEIKNIENGTIGVDLNHDLVATTSIKTDGNYQNFQNYKLDTDNWTSNRTTNEVSLICDNIVEQAKSQNKSITIEDLDLTNKKYDNNKVTNRKVSMLIYSKFRKLLTAKCIKSNVKLNIINPAFTSIIGKYKYCKNLGISVHNSAALVIGRRGMFNKNERIPSKVQELLHCEENLVLGSWKQWSIIRKSLQTSYPTGFSLKRELSRSKDNLILNSNMDKL